MSQKIFITGGAGFIGSHLVNHLLTQGHEITIFDNLIEQVHGRSQKSFSEDINFIKGSVNDFERLKKSIMDHDVIIHLAAMVGVGQSMYQIRDYSETNVMGTANLLEILVNSKHDVKKLIIASSNTIYGEGTYTCENCGEFSPPLRGLKQLEMKEWEIKCPECGNLAIPILTNENSPFNPSSIYAITKQTQEQMGLIIGKTYGINTTILRFFLVYGSNQAPSNPYTGVSSIFSTRLLNNQPIIVFEDGLQTRDFIHVRDVCRAIELGMKKSSSEGEIFNVGTGKQITIKQVAEIITEKLNSKLHPIYNNKFRIGDIRHCVADISKIKSMLGFNPTVEFTDGINDLIQWIKSQKPLIKDKTQNALNELNEKGLIK